MSEEELTKKRHLGIQELIVRVNLPHDYECSYSEEDQSPEFNLASEQVQVRSNYSSRS